jgi:Fe-S-cluster containining protein
MWTITVDEAKVAELRREEWPGGEPFRKRLVSEGDTHSVRMVGGRCFFLDEDNRCRIHAKLGYNAKPEGCKAFPLLAAGVAGRTHLRLSFYCPAVTARKGKRLQEQKRWIQSTIKAAGDVTREAPLTLDGELEITARDLEAIASKLGALIRLEALSMADRLAAGAGVLERLRAATAKEGKAALGPTLKQLEQVAPDLLAREGREGGAPSRAGPVLSLFLGHDCAPGALARVGRFFGVRLFNLGLGRLRSRLMQARASRGAIQRTAFAPEGERAALLSRYLLHKLEGRRILTGEHSLISGFNLLVAAYSVISLLARLRAADRGDLAATAEDVIMAVQAADLLVMEHTALFQGGVLADLTEAVLAQDRLCASLLARVEPVK